jgi:hypothetical protein
MINAGEQPGIDWFSGTSAPFKVRFLIFPGNRRVVFNSYDSNEGWNGI